MLAVIIPREENSTQATKLGIGNHEYRESRGTGSASHQAQEKAAGLLHLPCLLPSHPQELDCPDAQAHLDHFQTDHMEQAAIQISGPESRMAGCGRSMEGQASWLWLGDGGRWLMLPKTNFSPPLAHLPPRSFYRCLLKGLSKVMFSSTVAFSSHGF